MRFLVSVVSATGNAATKHPILPGGVVRMDNDEMFRVMFENDWDSPGEVICAYNGNTFASATRGIEPGEILVTPTPFKYERARIGEARTMTTLFRRNGRSDIKIELHLINNDYNKDGSAVHFGDKCGDGIPGRAVRKEDDPDRHQRASV